MNCKTVQSHLTAYVLGQLDSGSTKDLENHLRSCPDCRAEHASVQNAWDDLGAVRESEPGPMLRSRFYRMLDQEKQHADQETVWEKVDRWLVSWWPRRPAVQFGVSIAILLLGLFLGTSFSFLTVQNGDMASLRSEVREMRQFMSLSLMAQPSSVQRIQGVSLTRQVSNPDASLLDALFETVQTDPSVNVRLAAVDALYLFRDRDSVRSHLVQSLKMQDSPLVQVALIDLLTQMREQRALEALRSIIQNEDVNPDVRAYAEQKTLEMS